MTVPDTFSYDQDETGDPEFQAGDCYDDEQKEMADVSNSAKDEKKYDLSVTPRLFNDRSGENSISCVGVNKPDADVDNLTSPTDTLLNACSDWFKIRRTVAVFMKYGTWLKNKRVRCDKISVNDMKQAETAIVRYVQNQAYNAEIKVLRAGRQLPKKNPLYALDPYVDEHGVMRVGGRLRHARIDEDSKHQMLFPSDSPIATHIIRHVHENVCLHGKSEYVLALLRRCYWMPRVRTVINRVIRRCTTCQRQNSRPQTPRMADLPPERLAAKQPPFTNVGIDCFGPFVVKRGRTQIKRYGLIFTCLTIRAIHLEVLPDLTTDAFIDALRRFIARRGKPARLVSDNGTNFVGAYRELGDALREWNNKQRLHSYLLQEAIEWQFNPPAASHMGGVWERQIRSVRRVFNSVIRNRVLDDFELHTVFCEIEAVINNRPLTKVSDDPDDLDALTPNHLLAPLRSTATIPPVASSKHDEHGRRWKFIQHLADLFWIRWTREYLPTVQHRQKWLKDRSPTLQPGELVLLVDELRHRNQWRLARVIKTLPGRDGKIRACDVKTSSGNVTRPVTKLCRLGQGVTF